MLPSRSVAVTNRPVRVRNALYTRRPSHAWVAEACEFFGLMFGSPTLWASVVQSGLPVARSNARIDCSAVFSSAVVRNTRPPQTIGLECPRPGTGVFHATLSVADQR